MRTLALFTLSTLGLYAFQVFPGAVPTDSDLLVAADRAAARLTAAIDAATLTLPVDNTVRFKAHGVVTVGAEKLKICAVGGSTLTVCAGGRGFGGTVAQSHPSEREVRAQITEDFHNRLANELKGITGSLGVDLANVAKKSEIEALKQLVGIYTTDYDFAAQSPGGSLVAGLNVVTLAPVPKGVKGGDDKHHLYVFDGVGAAEPCRITGGSAVSGAASGQIFLTCANAHSGAWKIRSATAGIQEAINTLPAQGGIVTIPAGRFTLYGPTIISGGHIRLIGSGFYSTWLETQYSGADLIQFDGGDVVQGNNSIEYMTIVGPGPAAPTATNYGVTIRKQFLFRAVYVNVSSVANGFLVHDEDWTDNWAFDHCWASWFYGSGFRVAGSNGGSFNAAGAVGSLSPNAAGFRIEKTGGILMHHAFGFAVGYGLLIAPGAGQSASLMWVNNSIFDNCERDAVRITPMHSTAHVHSVNFVNSYSTFSRRNGFYLSTEHGGRIEEISLTAHRALLNDLAGVVIRGEQIRNITITGSTITSSSTAVSGTSDEIFIDPASDGPNGLTITNNVLGPSSYHGHNARFGINFGYGHPTGGAIDNVILTGNRISDKVSTIEGVKRHIVGLDNISGKNIIAKDNQPEAHLVRPAARVGALLALGGDTVSMFTTTGGNVNQIVPHWKGREITITKLDAGSQEFNTTSATVDGFRNTVTLNEGESLRAIHDGSKWNLIK